MLKRILLFTVLAICLTGCLNRKIKLDYMQVPDQITIRGYENKDEMDKLNTQFEELKTKHASIDEQQKVLDKIGALAYESMLEVKDKGFINNVMEQIKNSEGTIEDTARMPKSKAIFGMQFNYENTKQATVSKNGGTEVTEVTNNTIEDFKQGYVSNITIFSDGTVFIPKYDENASTNAVMIKVKLDQETIKFITDYYNSKKK